MKTPSFFKNWLAIRRFKRLKKRIDSLINVSEYLVFDAIEAEEGVLNE